MDEVTDGCNEFEDCFQTIEDVTLLDENNDANIVVCDEVQVIVNDDDAQEIVEYEEHITTNDDDLIEEGDINMISDTQTLNENITENEVDDNITTKRR